MEIDVLCELDRVKSQHNSAITIIAQILEESSFVSGNHVGVLEQWDSHLDPDGEDFKLALCKSYTNDLKLPYCGIFGTSDVVLTGFGNKLITLHDLVFDKNSDTEFAHDSEILCFGISPDTRLIFTATNNSLALWNTLGERKFSREISNSIDKLHITNTLVLFSYKNDSLIYYFGAKELDGVFKSVDFHEFEVSTICCTNDDTIKYFCSGDVEGNLIYWSLTEDLAEKKACIELFEKIIAIELSEHFCFVATVNSLIILKLIRENNTFIQIDTVVVGDNDVYCTCATISYYKQCILVGFSDGSIGSYELKKK